MVRIGGAGCMRGNGLGRMTWHTRKNKLVRREKKGGEGDGHFGGGPLWLLLRSLALGSWIFLSFCIFLFSIKLDQCIQFSISGFFILAI